MDEFEENDEVFQRWRPKYQTNAIEHPCSLYESKIMQSIDTVIDEPLSIIHTNNDIGEYISNAQIEAIAMCICSLESVQSYETNSRGFFLGDGTGVGKTRILAGSVAELYSRDSTNFRVLWVTPNKTLIETAKKECKIVERIGNQMPSVIETINNNAGILYITYNSLSKSKLLLKNWISQSNNSLIIFDEAHMLKNSNTKMSEAAMDIQSYSLKGRAIYSTATAASKVSEIHYMSKLGLWDNHKIFCKTLERYGSQAVIFIALQLKYNSKICARNLGFDGIQIDVSKCELSQSDIVLHDEIVKKIQLKHNFYGIDFLNFFNYFITSFKLNHTIKLIEKSLEIGESVIIGLNFTGETAVKRGFSSNVKELLTRYNIDIDGYDFKINPIDYIINYFGSDNVAEISGRSYRYTFNNNEIVKIKNQSIQSEIKKFANDTKKIAIITKAGSAGISLNGVRPRHHIILELPKSADNLTQQFGRAYRANSVSTPHYTIITTNIPSEVRFINGIQKKLEDLGAISKGDKNTGVLSKTNIGSNSITTYAYNYYNFDFQLQFSLSWMKVNDSSLEYYDVKNLVKGFDEFDSYLKNYALPFFTNLLSSINHYVFYNELNNRMYNITENKNSTLNRYTNWNPKNWRYIWSSFTKRFNSQPIEKIILMYRALLIAIQKYLPQFADKFSDINHWNYINHLNHTQTTKTLVKTLLICSNKYECVKTLGTLPLDLYGSIIDYLIPVNHLTEIGCPNILLNFTSQNMYIWKNVNDFMNTTFTLNMASQNIINNIMNENIENTRTIEKRRNSIKHIDDFILKGKTDFYTKIVKTNENSEEILLHVKILSKYLISDYVNLYVSLKQNGKFINFIRHNDNQSKVYILAKSEKYYYDLYEICNTKPVKSFMEVQWQNKEDQYQIISDYNWVYNTKESFEQKMKICNISYHLTFTINNAIKNWNSSTGIVLKITNVENCRDFIGLLLKNSREFHD
ncbi:putative DEAD/DEAH box helicase [Aureococcus anophagefferens virus]|uniref:Putative DEAD/DEAH box helicase n=1 Tax=Aureococcus anophagefferens virus TaxID=1474867 RepID=A0A076FMQ0_9VIRU|nr:putative DEAD/DEAH box helicase [Aureococcus anophagefferens virus]AII17208.1 putative DEAD/DEAH box helicase [Aureococcus anophagefferens virus]UOG94373.1 Helicase-like protein [Aureococcus anophagefferens virus]